MQIIVRMYYGSVGTISLSLCVVLKLSDTMVCIIAYVQAILETHQYSHFRTVQFHVSQITHVHV